MSNLLDDLAEQAITGVSFDKRSRKWRAYIRHSDRQIHLGFFAEVASANAARRAAELRLHGHYHASRAVIADGEIVRIPLVGLRGDLQGVAIVDAADLALVESRLWYLSSGYPTTKSNGVFRRLHCMILPDAREVDHRDGDRLNCRRSNLRNCSHAQNCRNTPARLTNRLGLKGVQRTPEGRFAARIQVDGEQIYLGRFDEAADAARAYDRAALQYHGDFARLNFGRVDQ